MGDFERRFGRPTRGRDRAGFATRVAGEAERPSRAIIAAEALARVLSGYANGRRRRADLETEDAPRAARWADGGRACRMQRSSANRSLRRVKTDADTGNIGH